MELTSHLPPTDRERVEARLHSHIIAWLTTVRPDGQPVSVPSWFLLRPDESILLYTEPGKEQLRNIAASPEVSLVLEMSLGLKTRGALTGRSLGRDVEVAARVGDV